MTTKEQTLVERLTRKHVCNHQGVATVHHLINPDGPEAADTILSLQSKLERMREALEHISGGARCGKDAGHLGDIARAALNGEK